MPSGARRCISLASHTYFSACAIPRARAKGGSGKEKYIWCNTTQFRTKNAIRFFAASGFHSTQLTCNLVSAVM